MSVRLDPALYRALEAIARRERRSVAQVVRLLVEDGLRRRLGDGLPVDDAPGGEVALVVGAGGAFDWLEDEPDLYDDSCGEPA